ncbi:hypothetical protein BC351_13315 [Paenibacillus ferrarius]|uniref:DUF429 domain-containing protein n=1 Tax=Paenibacillus ferrarius TaxID=1469647 RepID=A0A1V4H765_9BACL|nr:hypothetical protein [Paenibacillus ferrarius]OPH46899.1 hypothetical protein BC351_13315 [Paenibacillus ferrarius]
MQTKIVYGCDFSGAINPSEKIFLARAELTAGTLHIQDIIHCEERLDLYYHITAQQAYWGMDMPFAYPAFIYEHLETLSDWSSLYDLAVQTSRVQFKEQIEHAISSLAQTPTRRTDAALNAKSPLSKTPINMLGLTYGGFKLLAHLVRSGVNVYPFSEQYTARSCVYEVYPSHTWRMLGLKRGMPLSTFIASFNDKYPLHIEVKDTVYTCIAGLKPSMQMDACDAVAACVTMAYALAANQLDTSWHQKPTFATDAEWGSSALEGLIVRLS